MNSKAFIFFGRSGCGKGTQAKLLTNYLEKNFDNKVLYLETGAKFREFKEYDNYSSSLTMEVLDHGGLMPEFLPIWLWSDFLVKNFTGNEHLILDGTARRIDEASVLDSAVRFYKIKNPYVIYIDVSYQRSFEMMKGRGRKDDTGEYIKSRLDWFEKDVIPAIEYFEQNNLYTFLKINGEQEIEDVHKDILGKIDFEKK